MKISTKIWILLSIVLTLVAGAIKFYFLPMSERYAKLAIEDQMRRDMQGFEKIITVVVTAAQGNNEFVRRALTTISADKSIPIALRRSDFLQRQFGFRQDKAPANEFEKQALASGNAAMRTTDTFIEYAYPLKAQGVCMGCHVDKLGQSITAGTPVGLAISRVPIAVVTDSKLAYFALDLFWENFALVLAAIFAVIFPIYFWILRPVHAIATESDAILRAADEHEETDPVTEFEISSRGKNADELRALRRLMHYARRKHNE